MLAAVCVVGVVVARWLVHDEPTNDPELATSRSSAIAAPSGSAMVRVLPKARYEPALETMSVHGLGSGVDRVLAVGEHGAIASLTLGASKWTIEPSPTTVGLHAVALQLDSAIAVGDDGTIIELDFGANAARAAGAWKVAAAITKRALRAVAYTSYGAIAVGDGGTIVRRPGPHDAWQLDTSPATADLRGACAGLRDVWIVGAAGTIVMHTLDGWKLHAPVTPTDLDAVACTDHAGIAVGASGVVLERLDDVGWHASRSGVTASLLAVSSSIGTSSWLAAGASGTLVRITGDPTTEDAGITWTIRALTEGPLGTWLGGEHGVLRRR